MLTKNGSKNSGGTLMVSVDVEDWFQVENFKSAISFSEWETKELRVEENVHLLLDLFDSVEAVGQGPVKATFFILGWVAQRLPHLVREIDQRGHEVASHGLNHHLTSQLTRSALLQDLTESRHMLEDMTGKAVWGYRAPSFSVSPKLLAVARESGYRYDSSYNSFEGNSRYGSLDLKKNQIEPGIYEVSEGFYELPVTNHRMGGTVVPWGGGGYFRIIPQRLYGWGVRSIIRQQGHFLFYIHPWEFDPEQPRVMNAGLLSRFRHYINLGSSKRKLRALLTGLIGVRVLPCREYLQQAIL